MLTKILSTKQEEIKELYSRKYGFKGTTRARAIQSYPFVEALQNPKHTVALIAEIKKASPSKGLIRSEFDPVQLALDYERAGADCLSVLTDRDYFMGDPEYIWKVKEQVQLPILRKDFIVDPIQVEQSVELGADAILLIARALSLSQLEELYLQATEVGLDVLIEVHNREELVGILALKEKGIDLKLIGVNNRNLDTFETSIEVTKDLRSMIPEGVLCISESGIQSKQDIVELSRIGVHGFLIGEHFMRQENIVEAVKRLYE
ncbi:indole-3-glycerol phosphate synthase TrpC [Bacillus horti]|uniref:Indole-3-glycerol phosphate synthase n=1 Tax=Caldalkalibacillus horti TaxID=77523 RepID=A0ABT9VWX0_9BACI|nr:indole-3-glycerol phosphate synthase TrpC [Bacillus horti]MDQ0165476.1 indole-3-glycerol phosphate synthase [Bacillus horti]